MDIENKDTNAKNEYFHRFLLNEYDQIFYKKVKRQDAAKAKAKAKDKTDS